MKLNIGVCHIVALYLESLVVVRVDPKLVATPPVLGSRLRYRVIPGVGVALGVASAAYRDTERGIKPNPYPRLLT